MAPKRKPSGRPASGRPKPRPRPNPSRPSPTESREWWMLGEFAATSSTSPGVLETVMLHPSTFPLTPYAAACAHHTHRRELLWEFDVHVTGASTTGVRAAVGVIPDPNWDPRAVSRSMMWGMVGNGMATMISGNGTGSKRATLSVRGATDRLSNAQPTERNWLGFSSGIFCVMLLDPVQGVTAEFKVSIVVLARVRLVVHSPVPGFMAWASNYVEPQGSKYWMKVQNQQNMPLNSHTASAWLAGGKYLLMTQSAAGATMAPKWVAFGVYTASHHAFNWENNDSQSKDPRYFVLWHEPGSGVLQMIGFENLPTAQAQAAGSTGLVPHGTELCVSYSGEARWGNRFEGLSDNTTIQFTLIWKAGNAYEVTLPATTRQPGEGPAPGLKVAQGPQGSDCSDHPEDFSCQGLPAVPCSWRPGSISPVCSTQSAPAVLTTGRRLSTHWESSSNCSDLDSRWELQADDAGSMSAVQYPAPADCSQSPTTCSESSPPRRAPSTLSLWRLLGWMQHWTG